jgi:hypothetical protein
MGSLSRTKSPGKHRAVDHALAERLRCPRCRRRPERAESHRKSARAPGRKVVLIDHTCTGLCFLETECPDCRFGYAWRVVIEPEPAAILADEWPLGQKPSQAPPPSFSGFDEAEAAGAFLEPEESQLDRAERMAAVPGKIPPRKQRMRR